MVKETDETRRARAKAQASSHLPRAVVGTSHSSSPPQVATSDGLGGGRIEYIRQAFHALGAPSVSADDMRRLCKGPLADALLFMAEHMKGRAKVNQARQTIQQMREAGPSSGVSSEGQQTDFMKAKHATARLIGAKNEFKEARSQLDSRLELVSKSQRELERLQVLLDAKRRSLFLLQVLEKKETIRSSRIKEVDRLMGQLQTEAVKLTGDVPVTNTATQGRPTKRIRAEHTQDVLAAYHIRLAGSNTSSNDHRHGAEARRKASEARLREALGKRTEEDLVEKCQRIARTRAERSLRYESPVPARASDELDDTLLDDMHARISEKEEKLQHLLNEIADLERACAKIIQSLSAFDELTRPELSRSLEEEVKAVEGYVDVLRHSIMQSGDMQGAHEDPIIEGKSWRQALQDVQADIEQAHAKGTFARSTLLLDTSAIRDSAQTTRIEELIASHQAHQAHVNERNSSLLARKLEKAKIGDALGQQIEKLLAEKDTVIAMSGSSK
ncbi:uncharacterized protein B0H18DRAFT_1000853 [Fomitopsis serialis]|uniref:uncharacterized protein n=1 Tax=Fomitopsis serialis TaxID=139415 RepID=UPI00200882CA|nr:uncharacterized protein B0H18DRAFT_1000853 [Neoantrodia serialis]KAH9928337.1 hypothetical protein B0H18DRAFT_1000853 [Neoantrodia serialis]